MAQHSKPRRKSKGRPNPHYARIVMAKMIEYRHNGPLNQKMVSEGEQVDYSGMNRDEVRAAAKEAGISNRSSMTKSELIVALQAKNSGWQNRRNPGATHTLITDRKRIKARRKARAERSTKHLQAKYLPKR